MHQTILVEQAVQNGWKLVEELQKRLPISAAFWMNMNEANDWRLVIVSPLVAEGGAQIAYRIARQAIAEIAVPIPIESVSFLSPVDLRYKRVREASQGVPSGITMAENFAGLGFAGDAYVYVMN